MEVLPLDITDFEQTSALIARVKPDAVVNSAIADYRGRNKSEDRAILHAYHLSAIEVNARGAYHIYEASFRAEVPRMVFMSSMTVVAGQPRYEILEGDDAPRPADVYACTKLFGEQLGHVYAHRFGMTVTNLRLGQPCPMRPDWEPIWCRDPKSQGIMVHFEDIARATYGALQVSSGCQSYTIVSDSEFPRVKSAAIPKLNYTPIYRFTTEGPVRKD